jgi:hypothetical protein
MVARPKVCTEQQPALRAATEHGAIPTWIDQIHGACDLRVVEVAGTPHTFIVRCPKCLAAYAQLEEGITALQIRAIAQFAHRRGAEIALEEVRLYQQRMAEEQAKLRENGLAEHRRVPTFQRRIVCWLWRIYYSFALRRERERRRAARDADRYCRGSGRKCP